MQKTLFTILYCLFFFSVIGNSQDPNFHIYLCFGQSNMEGQGTIQLQDREVNERFVFLETVNCSNLSKTKGEWYPAIPPLTRCWTRLSPADYFGRTMVTHLPLNVKVGVVNVSVGGCNIGLFDKENYTNHLNDYNEEWYKNALTEYSNNPYAHLVEMAKKAQQEGVIKGILLHQGETNNGDTQWPAKVKKIYNNLISDLGLVADSVPLIAGELVHADQGGVCAGMNSIIAKLPTTLPNSYIVSSKGCTDQDDNIHFNSAGYRKLGIRYAIKMLSLMGIEQPEPPEPEDMVFINFESECTNVGEKWNTLGDAEASNKYYISVNSDNLGNPADTENDSGFVKLTFQIEDSSTYYIYGLINCETTQSDAFWLRIDEGEFILRDNLITEGWQWVKLSQEVLSIGEHILTIANCENGAKLDKICISNYLITPTKHGKKAVNICEIDPATSVFEINRVKNADGYVLNQNYPNPFEKNTQISFVIPHKSDVSLKIYTALGAKIKELGGKEFTPGKHTLSFNNNTGYEGNLFYTLQTDQFMATRKMTCIGGL